MDNIGNYASSGLFVNERIPIQVPVSRKTFCFMGAYTDDNEYWIDFEDYDSLLNNHQVSSSITNNASLSSGAILAVGIIDINDNIILENWFALPNAEVQAIPTGPYAFRYLDNQDNLLYQLNFDITFTLDTGESEIPLSETPFALLIPNIPNTAKIQIIKNTTQLSEKVVSQNAPSVNLISPNGGEIYFDSINIQWSGSDLDGDPLTYSIFISADQGTTWEPIVGNLSGTNQVVSVQRLSAGTQYLLKVIATDGINTSEDISDGVFSINKNNKNIYLPFVSK